jgi:hypothetical protein
MEEHPLSDHMPKTSLSEVKINGEWKIYALMSKNYNTPYQLGRYLGMSTEIRLDGFCQNTLEVEYHFWEKADDE